MSDILIFLIFAVILTGTLYLKARYDVRRRREEELEKIMIESDSQENATRRLIGDEAYERMEENVRGILSGHRADRSINVSLSTGPDTPQGEQEFHSLLPGDPLWLRRSSEEGVDVVDVYSGGYRIGRLMLEAAQRVISIMDKDVITGSYVSEQNSYGDCDTSSLGIVIFHTPRATMAAEENTSDTAPYRITVNGPRRIVLYQN